MIINNNATLKESKSLKEWMTSTELMPVVMIIPLLHIEANKINMASYVLTDLSGSQYNAPM